MNDRALAILDEAITRASGDPVTLPRLQLAWGQIWKQRWAYDPAYAVLRLPAGLGLRVSDLERRLATTFDARPAGGGPGRHRWRARRCGKGAVVSTLERTSAGHDSAGRIDCCLGWAKAGAVSVPMLASAAMTCAVGGLLPPVPGLVLFTLGLVIAGALFVGRVEPLAVRLLYGGTPLTVADQRVLAPVVAALCAHGLGPPMVQVWVRPDGPPTDVTATGRRSMLVNRSLIEAIQDGAVSVERATTLLTHAGGLVRSGATRADPFLRFWTIPWVLLTHAMVWLGRIIGVADIVQVMWKGRWILAAIAVVQAVTASHPGLAVLVSAIGTTTYLWPQWVRTWHARVGAIGDEAVARVLPPAPPSAQIPALRGPRTSPALPPESSRRRRLSVVR